MFKSEDILLRIASKRVEDTGELLVVYAYHTKDEALLSHTELIDTVDKGNGIIVDYFNSEAIGVEVAVPSTVTMEQFLAAFKEKHVN